MCICFVSMESQPPDCGSSQLSLSYSLCCVNLFVSLCDICDKTTPVLLIQLQNILFYSILLSDSTVVNRLGILILISEL